MQEIPDCLNRRYKAIDDLVKDLDSASQGYINDDASGTCCNDPGVRLMCEFWNILRENPDFNLTKAVQQRMGVSSNAGMFRPQRLSCYVAHNCMKKNDDNKKKPEPGSKIKNVCCHKDPEPEQQKLKCCASKSVPSSQGSSDVLPLSKVLCNLKEAASFDRKCQGMVSELMSAQKHLQDQIQHLEHREEEGIQLLKQADCMWTCMEDAYKKKILESQERQQNLLKQLKEAEANTSKWRKNKKDLEFQLENVNTCHQEIFEKLNQKQNDIKCMNTDINSYKKRIENNKKELDAARKSLGTKKQSLDEKIKRIAADLCRKQTIIGEEKTHKEEKEKEGNQYIREARADLLNLSKVLLQKKIENEDMKTEKETLIDELELLSQTYDQCKYKCEAKKRSIEDEIKTIDNEIVSYKAKCDRCHVCIDTVDIRKFCTDCPRCLQERDCLYKDDHCSPDHTMDCVCMSVKQKFLDNVFENMYTVLERQIKTGPGKAVADVVLNCLKSSRNGKLDQKTRQILQDFILTSVKKNLNLTIIGGAVKTRCELDSDTYKQLMLCLKQVKAVRPPKADKETAAKKDPCRRWGGTSECNCPKGPKSCICTKKAPPPPNEPPAPCPPQDKEDMEDLKICPYKESACGPDCAMHAVPSAVGTDVAAWRPDPCQAPTCQFKNMRAAQCVLGPEALNTISSSGSYVTAVPYVPNLKKLEDQISCKCGKSPTKLCNCKTDRMRCDKNICDMTMNTLVDEDINLSLPIDNSIYNQSCQKEKEKIKIKEDLIKEQFEPILMTKSINNEIDIFKNCTQRPPENRKIKHVETAKQDIDKSIMDLIENITKEDPNSYLSLNQTKSGHLRLDLNSVSKDTGENILIKRSPSGSIIIEINNENFETLTSKMHKKKSGADLKSKKEKEEANVATNVSKFNDAQCVADEKILQNKFKNFLLNNSKEKISACKSKQEIITKSLLQKWYKKGQKKIKVRIKCKNTFTYEQAQLTEMSSENVGIYLKTLGTELDPNKREYSVLLYRRKSDIIISFEDDASLTNGIARRTVSNGLLIYINEENAIEIQNNEHQNEKIIKIKLKGLNDVITEPPAVIKQTPSGNYDIILEKEFEKYYKETIKHHTCNDDESYFDITNTSSTLLLDFEKSESNKFNNKKALLLKSSSGLLKIKVSDPNGNTMNDIQNSKILSTQSVKPLNTKALSGLLKKLPTLNPKNRIIYQNKATTPRNKSSSDSNLYDNSKINLQSNENLFEKSSTTLKKTASGQYTVVLDKESKKYFINNLIKYLGKSSKRVIPIKRSDSGKITIVYNKDIDNKGTCGSLKMTDSGNIYVILDEKVIQQINNDTAVNTGANWGDDITHVISEIENPENKGTATSCNAYPDDSFCEVSKCVCGSINRDYLIRSFEDKEQFCGNKCSGLCDKQSIKSNNMSPHIVIKPSESRPMPDKHNKFQESYYCEMQSVCPYHKHRYENASNELLEISGLCNTGKEVVISKIETHTIAQFKSKEFSNCDWDSFEYLPPQLPPFLKNIIYS